MGDWDRSKGHRNDVFEVFIQSIGDQSEPALAILVPSARVVHTVSHPIEEPIYLKSGPFVSNFKIMLNILF